ncbi:MAG: hypothetical protein EOO10_17970 [Chitinophagaceae bacterium]|nr:MAG: hypothetical protein EOO10_17970 [Chitinophagaceae bacterium]
MKVLVSLFISTMLFVTVSFGQTNGKGKVYVSKTLEYLHLLSDSTLWASIGEEHDTTKYHITGDTLFIQNEYWQTGANHKTDHIIKWQDYKIIKNDSDTLFLLNTFKGYSKPFNWEDTLKFVSLVKLKETVAKFKYLKLDYSNPFDGTLKLTIDSSGKVNYERTPEIISGGNVLTRIKGELTKREFANFLDTLAYSLPSRLARQRSCGIDGAMTNFEIAFNDKIIISKGCSLKWTHAFLFNYLYDIGRNKGFVKRQRG